MIINMTTYAARKTHYIDKTFDYLYKSDGRDIPVNLILGSYDTSHIDKYRGLVNLVPWDESAQRDTIGGSLRRSCSVNAVRALRYGDDEFSLCCEDDIGFKPDWYSQLKLTIEQIEQKEYILNLGQPSDHSSDKRYATHTRPSLVGAQGIFYPSKKLRNSVAAFVYKNMVRGMNDNLIGEFGKNFAKLYNTTPMLVWHIGQVSSFNQ